MCHETMRLSAGVQAAQESDSCVVRLSRTSMDSVVSGAIHTGRPLAAEFEAQQTRITELQEVVQVRSGLLLTISICDIYAISLQDVGYAAHAGDM